MTTSRALVCPWWTIYSFDNPLRRLVQDPDHILGDLVCAGDRCVDVGCGYGYFTVPMARMVGPSGTVVAVDIQPQMLRGLKRRAQAHDVASRIRMSLADASGLHLDGLFDFALAFWMIHEVPDQEAILSEIFSALKKGGRFLLTEPRVHVGREAFRRTVERAEKAGFTPSGERRVFFSRALLMSATRA